MSLRTACKSRLVTWFPETFATSQELHALWRDRLRQAGLAVTETNDRDAQGRPLSRDGFDGLPPQQQHDLTRNVGDYVGRVLAMRVHHPTFTSEAFRLDERGRLALADASGLRGYKGTPLLAAAMPMLFALQREFRPSRSQKFRFYKAMVSAWPVVPDGLHRLPRHRDFR